jgi:hypothetical protein
MRLNVTTLAAALVLPALAFAATAAEQAVAEKSEHNHQHHHHSHEMSAQDIAQKSEHSHKHHTHNDKGAHQTRHAKMMEEVEKLSEEVKGEVKMYMETVKESAKDRHNAYEKLSEPARAFLHEHKGAMRNQHHKKHQHAAESK